MSYQACIAAITEAAGEILPEDEVTRLVEQVQRRYAIRKKRNPLEDERVALAEIAKGIADEEKLAAIIERRNRAINVLRKQQRQAFYDNFGEDRARALHILNVGSDEPGAGFGNSVDAQAHALEADLSGPMVAELRAEGLDKLVSQHNPDMERVIARNMWELSNAEIKGVEAKLTGPEEAQKAARIYHKYQEAARQMQNDAGAWIGRAPGYIVRQAHDPFRIKRAGFQAWKDSILPKLDPEMFDDIGDPDGFLRSVYNGLVTGEHYRDRGAQDWLGGFKGPGNLAKRASQERVLHFKSADDWFDYNNQFGVSSLTESVFLGLRRAARNTALMKTWGTNPRAAFEADLDQARQSAARRGDEKQVTALNSWRLSAEFDQLDGTATVPGSPSWARIGASIRAIFNLASLGGVTLSSLPDIAIKAFTLKRNGVSLLEGYANGMQDFVRGRGKGKEREVLDLLGVGYQGLTGAMAARFSAQDSVPGTIARMENLFFKLNALSWWTDSKASGVGLMLSRQLARHADADYAALPKDLQDSLARYGIQADQWSIIRRVEKKLDGDTEFITPDALDLLPLETFAPLANDNTAKAMERARNDLRINLRAFFTDQVNAALTIGGAKERAIITWGTRPGTPLGEAVRFLMQYKLFPITFATKHLRGQWTRNGVPGVVHMMIHTTVLGYLAYSAKELARGRSLPDPTDGDVIQRMFVQGGGAGIYGDFLLAEYNRHTNGGLEAVLGPGASKLAEVLTAFADLRDGDVGAAARQFIRTTLNTTPGVNLFYTRAALDYLFLYQIQEIMSPGYLRRMEKFMKEQGNSFIIPPSSTIPYGGGNRFAEGVR